MIYFHLDFEFCWENPKDTSPAAGSSH
jgi:hypothetical protein